MPVCQRDPWWVHTWSTYAGEPKPAASFRELQQERAGDGALDDAL